MRVYFIRESKKYGKLWKIATVCPKSSNPFHIVNYYIKWVTTSWTDGKSYTTPKNYRKVIERKVKQGLFSSQNGGRGKSNSLRFWCHLCGPYLKHCFFLEGEGWRSNHFSLPYEILNYGPLPWPQIMIRVPRYLDLNMH